MDWSLYPNFKESEFRCSHCGAVDMDPAFLAKLQVLRNAYGKPMPVNSGYRCPLHPNEASKAKPGAHTSGKAADISVQGSDAHQLLRLAFAHGFTGIGVNQKGGGQFIHLDTMTGPLRPAVWSY